MLSLIKLCFKLIYIKTTRLKILLETFNLFKAPYFFLKLAMHLIWCFLWIDAFLLASGLIEIQFNTTKIRYSANQRVRHHRLQPNLYNNFEVLRFIILNISRFWQIYLFKRSSTLFQYCLGLFSIRLVFSFLNLNLKYKL